MPALKELAQLGKAALLAFVAPLLTELASLKARVEELLAENAALKAQLDRQSRDAKRQAAPFSKGPRNAQPKRPGRKPGQARFTFRILPRPDPCTAPSIEVRLPESNSLRDQVPTSGIVSTDDTGWRVGGEIAQLMVFVTDMATVFQVRPQHRSEEVREVIGDASAGVLVTDRGKSYDAKELEGVKQQKGIAHALRSINEVLESKRGRARRFGARLKKLLKEGLELWHEYHDHHGQLAGFERRARSVREAVTRHLHPRRLVDADNQRLLEQFGRHHSRGNLLRFLEDPRVKPTNNDLERGFRFAVIQRKVSQCSKSTGGARAFEAFAIVIKTAMRQGKNVVERLTDIFRGLAPQSSPT